ncbi:hypothetical protein [Leptolyngbya sp. FACHB-261]|uniref:hypothetical protein n=1 Tax=Leptolyngbya sp. FACHB-261 TaxID=2692806 RepID=UPI001689A43B|nr:hypothetical protein [Leptolyngbya sp. FACHB-261]MBD2105274.1 hypothetical protein [Leptolyngbya sp. FACHB-261]
MTVQQNIAVATRFMNDGIAIADMSVFDETLDPDITVTTALLRQACIRLVQSRVEKTTSKFSLLSQMLGQ